MFHDGNGAIFERLAALLDTIVHSVSNGRALRPSFQKDY